MFRLLTVLLIATSVPLDGFSLLLKPVFDSSKLAIGLCRIRRLAAVTEMESDFGSAMPERPGVSPDEHMMMCAENFVLSVRGSLAEGTEEPPELQVLADAVENGAGANELAIRVYELMIERGMMYDVCPDTGILTETQFDIPSNLDVDEVRKEFLHLYTYGMNLIQHGLLSIEDTKTIVEQRLIPRTGLTPVEFDEWLGF
jgi:hypothetical protein